MIYYWVKNMENIKERLEKKNLDELKKLADLKGVKNYESLNKTELIKKLLNRYEIDVSSTC
jgi:hypothetical protein